MSLLAPQVEYYVINEKWWGWGSGDIYDRQGNTIGHMHRRVLSIREFTEVNENDGSLAFSINRKLVSVRSSYMIKDAKGNLLGRTNRKILTLFRPKLWLEDEKGKKLLEAQGNFLGKDFKIEEPRGRVVAQVGKGDFLRDLFLGGVFNYSDTYAVRVIDPHYDKKIVLGLVLAIDNSVHDNKR